MIEALMFFGGLVPALLLGVPLAVLLSKPRSLRARAARDKHALRAKVEVARAFAPLDLGPDPVRWPSERAWPTPTLRSPDWPSASWNDEHFGVGRKKPTAPPEPPRQVPEPRRPHRGPAPRRAIPELSLDAPINETTGAPGRDEIERLIAQSGLAGTVQAIIDRTGWDFRQAAQHLARTRQRP